MFQTFAQRLRQATRRSLSLMALGAPFAAWAAAPQTIGPAGTLYMPEMVTHTVAVIDTATQKVVERLSVGPLGKRPAVLAATLDGRKIYVDNFGLFPATVSIIERPSHRVRTMRVGSTALGIFTSQDGSEIYVPEVGFTVEVIDVKTDKVVRKLRFPDIPAGAMSGPDGNLYVSFVTGFMGVYHPKTGAVIRKPIWTGGFGTFWFSFSKDGKKLYTDSISKIGVIDMDSWKLVKTIDTNDEGTYHLNNPGAFTSTLSPDGSKLYVTRWGKPGVLVVDTQRDEVIHTMPSTGQTVCISFSDDGSRGYISDLGYTTTGYRGAVGDLLLFFNIVGPALGVGDGQVIAFDPRTDLQSGPAIPMKGGATCGVWLPPLK